MTDEFNMKEQRTERWLPTTESDYIQITNPELGFNGSTLPRSIWSKLNRIWTGHGKCADSLHRWGLADSPRAIVDHRDNDPPYRSDCPILLWRKPPGLRGVLSRAIEWLCNLDINI
ncbi:hypothetical protein JTB14_013773 [Gonioctena quinquepunctata]|nr:hypothetical protein JTB14_013773 [Gonioctena quinquepunctata]